MSGKSWLLLRGLGRQVEHWGLFAEQFQTAFPQDKVYLLDLPGLGSAAQESSGYAMKHILSFVRKRYLNLSSQPVSLVGHSLGGMVAMEWLRLYPKELERLVITNTSASGLIPMWQRLSPKAAFTLFRAAASANDKVREELILKLVSQKSTEHAKTLTSWVQIAKSSPVKFTIFLQQLLAASTFKLPNENAKIPTLILGSYGDELVDVRASLAISKSWPSATLRIHPWSGHELSLDAPDWMLAEIKQWLNPLSS